MKRSKLFYSLGTMIFLVLSFNAFAQQRTITGIVQDTKDNAPLDGATVAIKNSTVSTVTNSTGKFEIKVPNGKVDLEVSYIGHDSKSVTVRANESNIVITLSPSSIAQLSEVVVLGYETQQRHKLTSAVSTVSGEMLNKRVAANPTALLQGQLPGLEVTQGSGQPGSESMRLRVRGLGTFSGAGTNPLVIIDGLPGSLDNLNQNDIESVSLLKDAASAAIYGSRGANGVIVVKTKKGKRGGFSLQYDYNIGIANATKLPDFITNSATYMELFNQARTNSNQQPIYTQEQIDLYKNATDRVKYPNHNWLNDVFKTASTQNHYLNMSGGDENTNYSLGIGIADQPGVMIGFENKKYTLGFGLTSKINKRITIGSNINFKYNKQLTPRSGGDDMFLSTLAQSPLYPPRMSNGLWVNSAYPNELHNKNPVAIVDNDIRTRYNDYYVQGNLSLKADIIDGLQWETKIGANYDANDNNDFRPVILTYNYSDTSFARTLDNGSPGLSVNRNSDVYLVGYSQFTYNKMFGDNNVSALAGYQQEHDHSSSLSAQRAGAFTTNLLRELNAGPATNQTNSGSSADWALRSYYGNVNYDYKDKYLAGASIRYDGTSRLPADTRWGLFYAFSGGWRISEESFLKNTSWLNDLKIRGSWGRLGNQNIGTYPYQPTLSQRDYPFGGSASSGLAASSLVDPNLTWETTQVLDFGVDLSAFDNKLTFTGDWFNKYTFDILRGSQVADWLGLNAPIVNNGALRNKGIELGLNYKDVIGQSFSYYVSANFQNFRNKLVSFGQREISSNIINQEGHEYQEYYVYIWDGIFQSQDEIDKSPKQPVKPTPGDLKIKDVNNDGTINDKDRTFVKGKYPLFQYSLNVGGAYKNLDLSMQLYGSQGQKIYVTGWGIQPFNQGSLPTTDWLNAWTPNNHTNTMPKIYAEAYQPVTSYASTYFLKDASFMRIKNIEIGYTIPLSLIRKIAMKSARVYFNGDNLFTFSKYPGLDPERLGDGRYVSYPQNRVYTFGVMVKF